jgi:hypothetical protein
VIAVARPKDLGTYRETWLVKKAIAAGLEARRAPNNAKAEDVLIRSGDEELVHEVKDREALSLHPLLKSTVEEHGEKAAVVWHRKKKGESRRSPAGPTLVAVTVDRYIDLLVKEAKHDRA